LQPSDDFWDALRVGMSDQEWDQYIVPRINKNNRWKNHNTVMHITRNDLQFLLHHLDLSKYPREEILEDYGRFPISVKYVVKIKNIQITDRQWRSKPPIVHEQYTECTIWVYKTLCGGLYPMHLDGYTIVY